MTRKQLEQLVVVLKYATYSSCKEERDLLKKIGTNKSIKFLGSGSKS